MGESVWYLYQDSQQTGPFEDKHILDLIRSNQVKQDAYLFKVGWKDWRPLEDCAAELGATEVPQPPEDSDLRRKRAPRATIKGRVIVHNNGQLVIGSGVNISSSGIFVETPDPIFKVGETLKLTCRVDGFLRAFNVKAKVVRFNEDKSFPIGYGLQFEALEKQLAMEIQRLIDQMNATDHSSSLSV